MRKWNERYIYIILSTSLIKVTNCASLLLNHSILSYIIVISLITHWFYERIFYVPLSPQLWMQSNKLICAFTFIVATCLQLRKKEWKSILLHSLCNLHFHPSNFRYYSCAVLIHSFKKRLKHGTVLILIKCVLCAV